jgi:hypothetical protein
MKSFAVKLLGSIPLPITICLQKVLETLKDLVMAARELNEIMVTQNFSRALGTWPQSQNVLSSSAKLTLSLAVNKSSPRITFIYIYGSHLLLLR